MSAQKKQINLFPKKGLGKNPAEKLLQWALTYGRYIIIGTEIVVLLAFISRFKLDRDLTDLREEIEQKSAIIEANRDFENEVREVQNRLSQIASLENNQEYVITLLNYVETVTPPEVFFTLLSLNDKSLNVSAHTLSPRGLTVFIDNMKQSTFFTGVTVDNLEQQETGEIRFQLSATIVQAGN